MYSERHRCVFVHIPKTGGTAIELFFTGHDWITRSPAEYAHYLAERGCPAERAGGGSCAGSPAYLLERAREKYATQAELIARLGRETWERCFRFTIVRNPWARLLAVFEQGRRDAPGRMPATLAAWLGQREPLDALGQPVLREWVSDWSALDFVGRFERLAKDFAQLLAILRLPQTELPLAQPAAQDPAAYDAAARRLVAERCGAEIERFDYRFEDAFLPLA